MNPGPPAHQACALPRSCSPTPAHPGLSPTPQIIPHFKQKEVWKHQALWSWSHGHLVAAPGPLCAGAPPESHTNYSLPCRGPDVCPLLGELPHPQAGKGTSPPRVRPGAGQPEARHGPFSLRREKPEVPEMAKIQAVYSSQLWTPHWHLLGRLHLTCQ